MKTLRFTTTKPFSMFSNFGKDSEPLVLPVNYGDLIETGMNGQRPYIDGQAQSLAEFDVPYFIDGDMDNLLKPVEEQNILMLLPSGEYECKCIKSEVERNVLLIRLK